MTTVEVLDRKSDHGPLRVVGWFETDAAEVFEGAPPTVERTVGLWSRSEYSEVPQRLYRTGEGRWVVRYNYGGSRAAEHRYLDDEGAAAWLRRHGHDGAASASFVEAERGPGRPEIGSRVQVRLGDLLGEVDTFAREQAVNRAEAVRRLVSAALRANGDR